MKKRHEARPFSVHRFQKRSGFFNDHHLKPRSRGGQDIGSNLFGLDEYRHSAWHLLFKNLTLDEIIALLIRVKQIKDKQRMRRFL